MRLAEYRKMSTVSKVRMAIGWVGKLKVAFKFIAVCGRTLEYFESEYQKEFGKPLE